MRGTVLDGISMIVRTRAVVPLLIQKVAEAAVPFFFCLVRCIALVTLFPSIVTILPDLVTGKER